MRNIRSAHRTFAKWLRCGGKRFRGYFRQNRCICTAINLPLDGSIAHRLVYRSTSTTNRRVLICRQRRSLFKLCPAGYSIITDKVKRMKPPLFAAGHGIKSKMLHYRHMHSMISTIGSNHRGERAGTQRNWCNSSYKWAAKKLLPLWRGVGEHQSRCKQQPSGQFLINGEMVNGQST